jgi:endonuclease III
MPMDDRAKATVRALLDRYPRGYVQEETGFTVTKTAAGLFRLLCLAVLADDSAPSEKAVKATKALLERRWDSAPEMAKSSEDERTRVLERAGYPGAAEASRRLGEATDFVLDRYDGDLNNLRRGADGDGRRLRSLIRQIPSLNDAGYAVFVRDAQVFWPEAGPFVDQHAKRAARRLGLPADPQTLLRDVARGQGEEMLGWLAGALALVDARDEYDKVPAAT